MPVYRGQPITGFSFKLRNPQTGGDVNSGSVTGYYLLDGGIQGTIAGTPVPEGHGRWSVNLLGSELDGAQVGLDFEDSVSGASASFTLFTEPIPTVATTITPGAVGPEVFNSTYFCSDEDVYLEVPGDYPLLVPKSQKKASGTDGSITAGSWTLTSTAVNFANRGVAAGMMVFLGGARGSAAAGLFGVSGGPSNLGGEAFVVDGVSGMSLTVRRPGDVSGGGEPPTSTNLTNITFAVVTVRPQIKSESDWIRGQIDWDEAADLIDADDLREQAMLRTIYKLYLNAVTLATMLGGVQGGGGSSGDVWAVKANAYKTLANDDLKDLISRRRSQDAVDSIGVVPIDL
jgi:hypothetical protein